MITFIILFSFPAILVLIDFAVFVINGKRVYSTIFSKILEAIVIIGIPVFYLSLLDFNLVNDCCSDSATFAPEHRLSVYTIIGICICAFFYNSFRKSIAPPVLEVIINSILVLGIVLNVFIAKHVEQPLWLFGNLPVILLFLLALVKNQKMVISEIQNRNIESKNRLEKLLWNILGLKFLYKVPVLFLLSLPLLMIIVTFLLLFGQKPDSIISAFTATYKHGFSQLDYLCDNVECGGHFLCSVAANGHKELVKPRRIGIRASRPILCNRQLLIANAFEELMEQNIPFVHKIIRKNYNKIGNVIHQYYSIFNNKIIADIIYVLMKPLEWLFLIVLYLFDRSPENRIAVQYLDKTDRNYIDSKLKEGFYS